MPTLTPIDPLRAMVSGPLVGGASTTATATIGAATLALAAPDSEALSAIPKAVAERYRVVPIERRSDYHAPLVSRVKVLANMDIAKYHMPQDGRFTIQIRGRRWDVRVSTIPGIFGETAVLRLLPKDTAGLALEDLGMQAREMRLFQSL